MPYKMRISATNIKKKKLLNICVGDFFPLVSSLYVNFFYS